MIPTSFYWRSLLLCIYLFVFCGCAPQSIGESERIAGELKDDGRLISHQLIEPKYSLHYMASCNIQPTLGKSVACEQHPDVKRILVFVHGTPGSWQIFAPQLADARWGDDTLKVAIDRPGWGQSALQSETIETSLVQQAEFIAPLLEQLKKQFPASKTYLVGHSLGGTLVPLIAIEYPELVDGVVAIAGDLFTEAFSPRWYNHVADLPGIRAIIPREMCFANEEVMALEDNLEAIELNWHKLRAPLLVLQGTGDGLVQPKNAEMAKTVTTAGKVDVNIYPDWGHLMHLEQTERVNSDILKWLEAQY